MCGNEPKKFFVFNTDGPAFARAVSSDTSSQKTCKKRPDVRLTGKADISPGFSKTNLDPPFGDGGFFLCSRLETRSAHPIDLYGLPSRPTPNSPARSNIS